MYKVVFTNTHKHSQQEYDVMKVYQKYFFCLVKL